MRPIIGYGGRYSYDEDTGLVFSNMRKKFLKVIKMENGGGRYKYAVNLYDMCGEMRKYYLDKELVEKSMGIIRQ